LADCNLPRTDNFQGTIEASAGDWTDSDVTSEEPII